MKEVWLVNQYAISPDLPGGTRHYDLGVELVRAGKVVRIFAANVNLALRQHVRILNSKPWLEEEINGVRFEWVQTNTYRKNNWRRVLNMLNFSWNVYRVAMKQKVCPGVVIGSSPHLFAALAGLRIARKLGCRFILEVRDLWPQTLVAMQGLAESHPVVKVLRWIEHYLYINAEHVIVLTEGVIPYLVKKGVPRQHITFIPNGVHPEHFVIRQAREDTRRMYGFDRFTVVYAGAHGPANSLHTVLEAANQMRSEPGVEYVLVGDGPSKVELQNRAQRMALPNLRFMPPVSKVEIPDLLAAADAAVITLKDTSTFYYGISPNKLFDYMAAGKAVLCAVPGEMAKMVAENRCGIAVPPEDGAALAEGTRQLAGMSTAELDEMGARGRDFVHRRLSRTQLARELIKLVNRE